MGDETVGTIPTIRDVAWRIQRDHHQDHAWVDVDDIDDETYRDHDFMVRSWIDGGSMVRWINGPFALWIADYRQKTSCWKCDDDNCAMGVDEVVSYVYWTELAGESTGEVKYTNDPEEVITNFMKRNHACCELKGVRFIASGLGIDYDEFDGPDGSCEVTEPYAHSQFIDGAGVRYTDGRGNRLFAHDEVAQIEGRANKIVGYMWSTVGPDADDNEGDWIGSTEPGDLIAAIKTFMGK